MKLLRLVALCVAMTMSWSAAALANDDSPVPPVYVPDNEDDADVPEQPPIHCQGQNCLAPEANPVLECEGPDCDPAPLIENVQ
jgi:hypothetical protein